MSNLIQELLQEGVIKCWIDARSGHLNDLSGNGNDGTPSAGTRFEGSALRFPTNTDEVTIADAVPLRFTTGTVLAFGEFRSMTATEYVISHDLAGSGFSLGINAGGLVFTGDGVARTIATNLLNVNCIAATFVSGGTPIGYVDGLSVGNFSGVVTVTATTVASEIGNWANSGRCISPLADALFINKILTATEMAQIYDELANMTWPISLHGSAKRTQAVFKADPKLISGWNLKPAGGVVPDEITTRDLTTIHNMVSKPGILGEGMSGPVEGYLATANDPYVHADFVNGYSMECWCRLNSLPALTIDYIQSTMGRMTLRVTPGGQVTSDVYDTSPGFQTASSAVGAVRANDLFHVVGTLQANGAVRLYINGVLQPTVDTMLGFNFAGTGRPMTWGAQFNATLGIAADFYKPRIYDYELSQEEVSAKYLEGAQAIQFKTDRGFQVSPAVEGGTLHQQIGTRGSPLYAGDTSGRWKIETDTVDGRLCKVLHCTTAGTVYVKASDFFDCTRTEAAFGTGELWFYKLDASLIKVSIVTDLFTQNPNDGHSLRLEGTEAITLYRHTAGVVVFVNMQTAAGAFSADTWTKLRWMRNSAGIFSVYINGVLVTATGGSNPSAPDVTHTVSDYLTFYLTAGDKICLGNVSGGDGIVKMLGVVAP